MSAKIIQFPGGLLIRPPTTERQIRHERMAELITQRARRKGLIVSVEDARASVTRAILEMQAQHEKVAKLLSERAVCPIEEARAALTRTMRETR